MKIGFDAKRLFNNFTGLGNYSRTLVKNLQQSFPENQFKLYTTGQKTRGDISFFQDNSDFEVEDHRGAFRSFWRSFGLVSSLKKDSIEVFHGLSNELPFGIKGRLKSVVTIHDLIFKVYPETYPAMDRKIYDLKFRYACKAADRVIAISECTKKDIVKYYGIDPDKIDVVYQSCNPIFFDQIEHSTAGINIQLPDEYLLFVGSVETRKNVELVVKAMSRLAEEEQISLVVVGKETPYQEQVKALAKELGVNDQIVWLNNLKDNNTLRYLYTNATCLVYPSKYEGFGLPVAESLLCKTPVITSNVSSLPEAGGPGAIYVDPEDVEGMKNAISKLKEDSAYAQKLADEGHQYAVENFAPEVATQRVMKVYQSLFA